MKSSSYYRLGVTIGGLGILIASIFYSPFSMEHIGIGLAAALFAAFQINFPLRLLGNETTLIHILGLGVGILYGFPFSVYAVTLGVIGGTLVGWKRNEVLFNQLFRNKEHWLGMGFQAGLNLIPLAWVWIFRAWAGGISGDLVSDTLVLGKITVVLLGFMALHSALLIIDFYLLWQCHISQNTPHPNPLPRGEGTELAGIGSLSPWERAGVREYDIVKLHKPPKENSFRRDLAFLSLINLLLLTFVIIDAQAFPLIQAGAFIILAGVLAVAEVLIFELGRTRSRVDRQVEELSTLNKISRTLQSTLALDELLPIIHQQVTGFLGIDNFYVALYDKGRNEIWYPLAVKHNQRQNWPRRPMEDRLTDRVILEQESILLTPRYQQGSDYIGLPSSAETPHSWMGVPLITSERALGCLAVMGFDPKINFTTADLNLLNTLSGQVGVAIENALLYASTDQALSLRVEQLATLERVGRELSAELDLDRLFDLILKSVLSSADADMGGLALFNEEINRLEIKVSQGYSQDFPKEANMVGIAGRTARTKQAQNIPDVRLDEDYHEAHNGSTRSQLSVPMLHNERLLGVITLESPHLGAFSENDQTFISQLADQAAIAVVNAELYRETQDRLREQILLYKFSRQIAGTLAFKSLLETVLEAMAGLLHPTTGGIYRWNPDEERYLLSEGVELAEASRHLPKELNISQAKEFAVGESLYTGQEYQRLGFYITATQQPLAYALFHLPLYQTISEEEQKLLETMAIQGAVTLQSAQLFSNATQERDRLDTVLDSVGEAILMIKSDGSVLLANNLIQTFTGTPLDEIIGVHFSELPALVQTALGKSAEEVTLLEDIWSGRHSSWPIKETYSIKGPNFERILERGVFPVGEGRDAMQGIVIVLRDITEEIQIRQDRELISETLVHDLRSPTSAVLGALDLIEDILPPKGENRDLLAQSLKVARHGTERVLRLIQSLLDISRLEAGSLELILDLTKIGSIVDDLLIEFVPRSNQAGIILQNNLPDNLPSLWADVDKLKRIVANLIDNAVKFTPEGGQVIISASQHGDEELLFQVRDTGPGVPAAYRKKIFERFVQVPGRQGRRRGSGLGLTFCRLAVEAHGGKIWVDEHPEGGSLFSFILPLEGPPPDGKQIIRRSYLANSS